MSPQAIFCLNIYILSLNLSFSLDIYHLCLWMRALKAMPSFQLVVKLVMFTLGYLQIQNNIRQIHLQTHNKNRAFAVKFITTKIQQLLSYPAVFIWHQRSSASLAERVSSRPVWSACPVSTIMSWICMHMRKERTKT